MRGKGRQAAEFLDLNGITPAYAGKSRHALGIPESVWDHPRLCGEKPDTGIRPAAKSGSPPPMRGKASHYTGGSIECRITPAYAGKRFGKCSVICLCQDHPRLCGEKAEELNIMTNLKGSPPPMRGKG